MSSIFRYTSVTYFQTPKALIESGVWAKLIPSAKDLYILLLYLAQETTKQVLSVTATDAERVGISANVVKAARENLVEHMLITATRKRDGYSYEILNPATGQPLHRIEDLSKVDPGIVGEYFFDQLAGFDPDPDDDLMQRLQSRCPFCEHKMRLRPFHVSYQDGGKFKCHSCKRSGGIVDFAIAMAEKNGETLDKDRGYSRVRELLVVAARGYEKRRAEEIAKARAML